MSLPKDPFMLVSFVNMKLRDENYSLDDLCETEGIEKKSLEDKLIEAGFEYMPDLNQFR